MTRPRSELVSVADTPWYHVVSRCVRRAFLCGEDAHTGRSFEHRRGWIEARIRQLASVFTIDVAAYAVMSNHYHIVLKIDERRSASLTDEEALARWTQLFSGPLFVQRYLDPQGRQTLGEAEIERVRQWAAEYRKRLADLSWYMRVLNEGIARLANKEDGVKGRFWEGRFKSQALLDEQALLSAMAYVDLNPIRAGLAETPEASDYTSVQARLLPEVVDARMAEAMARMEEATAEAANESQAGGDGAGAGMAAVGESLEVGLIGNEASAAAMTESDGAAAEAAAAVVAGAVDASVCLAGEPALAASGSVLYSPAPLLPFDATGREEWAIPFAFDDYVELVETLGRCVHPEKRGFIPEKTPALLDRLGIDTAAFIEHGTRFLKEFGHAVGKPAALIELAAHRQAKFLRGVHTAKRVFERKAA